MTSFDHAQDLQLKALSICGKWMRVSKVGIPGQSSCVCSYAYDVNAQQLDPLILEFLEKKFFNIKPLYQVIKSYRKKKNKITPSISRLLNDIATHKIELSNADISKLLDTLEISINSIEELH